MTLKDPEWLKHSPGVRAHLRIYVSNAEKRGIPFELTVAEATGLFAEDCHYCGLPPEPRTFSGANKRPYVVELSGIDRVDPSEGYTSDNTVACCKACNRAKAALGKAEFLAMARRVAKKHP